MIQYDFENGLFPAAFKNADSHPWVNTTDDASTGTRCLKSGNQLVNRTNSSFYIIGDFQADDFICDYKISSESGWDYGHIIVDGVPIVSLVSGNVPWTTMPAYALTAGVHIIQFVYIKDNSTASGSDAFFIDNVFVPEFVDLSGDAEFFNTGIPAGWVNDATHPWQAGSKMQTPFTGVESATIADSQTSELVFTSDASAPAGAMFFVGCADSQPGDDYLKLFIDGTEVSSDSGRFYDSPNRGPNGHYQTVSAGSHEYKFVYTKGAASSAGSDTGYLWLFYEPGMTSSSIITAAGGVSAGDVVAAGGGAKTSISSGSAAPIGAAVVGGGIRSGIGAGSASANNSTANGSGGAIGAVVGAGDVVATLSSASGSGGISALASGGVVADAAVALSSGLKTISAGGDSVAIGAAAGGAGETVGFVSGAGAVVALQPSSVGYGVRAVRGVGSAASRDGSVSGAGWAYINGAGDVVAGAATARGNDIPIIFYQPEHPIYASGDDHKIYCSGGVA